MKRFFLFIVSIVLTIQTFSQLEVDLSDPQTVTQTIELDKSAVVFRNILPENRNEYSFFVDMKEESIPAFEGIVTSGAPCEKAAEALNKAIGDVESAISEKEVSTAVKKLKTEMAKLSSNMQDCLDYCNELLRKTIYSMPFLFKLKNNQTLTITVKRQSKINGKDTTITWTRIFKTPEKSPWLIHFGFTYQPNVISKYDQFFAKEDTSTASRYVVTKKHGNQAKFWENLSPTIMFSYPISNKKGESHLAFSAIAATNFSTFSAGTGFSYIIGENVALGTGIMFTQKYVLNGIYKEGDIIKSNLNFEQLHEKKWGPEIYFTIGLRFDKNPFKGAVDKTSTDKKPDNNNDDK